jgi:histone H3/H4
MSDEVLVVVSKLKKYIKDASEMNTSGSVSDTLSNMIRRMCDKAIQNAKNDGRKTVMDRDFENI